PGRTEAAAAEAFRRLGANSKDRPGQLRALPALSQFGHRPRRSRQTRREGVRRGPARALPIRRTAGRGIALRAAFGRRHDRRWSALHPCRRGSWGPKEADALIASDGYWHNPSPNEASG